MGFAALMARQGEMQAPIVQSRIVETFMSFSAREETGVPMTEEATDASAAPAESPAPAETEAATNASLEKKFRTITGEEILRHTRPSFMAFFGYYLLAVFMMGVHWLFFNDNLAGLLTNDDSSALSTFLFGLLANDLTFMGVMLSLTWFNRMLNGSTSNRWLTVWMLLASVAPLLVVLDNWLTGLLGDSYPSIGSGGGLLPEYNYLIAGALFSGSLVLLTALYQRSFHYAVTSDAVIFDHRFLLVRGHRRILFEKISRSWWSVRCSAPCLGSPPSPHDRLRNRSGAGDAGRCSRICCSRRGEARRGRHQRGEGWKERHPPALGLDHLPAHRHHGQSRPQALLLQRPWLARHEAAAERTPQEAQPVQSTDELKAALTQE